LSALRETGKTSSVATRVETGEASIALPRSVRPGIAGGVAVLPRFMRNRVSDPRTTRLPLSPARYRKQSRERDLPSWVIPRMTLFSPSDVGASLDGAGSHRDGLPPGAQRSITRFESSDDGAALDGVGRNGQTV
jgi:hypothetical protein